MYVEIENVFKKTAYPVNIIVYGTEAAPKDERWKFFKRWHG